MTEFESQCFGISEQAIREQYMQSITARLSGLEMVVMGVLSDAQAKQGDSQAASVNQTSAENQNSNTPDSSVKKGNSEPQARQGNSRDAQVKAGAGKGYGTDTYEKSTNPGEGQIPFKEGAETDDDVITEEDVDANTETRKIEMNLEELRKDIASVFSGDET